MEIYEPREDSYLLLEQVKKHAKGRVLDMGTGSGILAKEAAKTADKVIAADINPKSRDYLNDIKFIQSDLFENINGKFNLIIFNPPYLPDDPDVKDIALDGGKNGYEIIERFLNSAGNHLDEEGKILLLFSSLSQEKKILKIIRRNNFDYKRLSSLKLDFEELFVYIIKDGG